MLFEALKTRVALIGIKQQCGNLCIPEESYRKEEKLVARIKQLDTTSSFQRASTSTKDFKKHCLRNVTITVLLSL